MIEKKVNNSVFKTQIINIKTLIIVVILAVGIILLFPKLVSLEEALKLLLKVNKSYLLLALLSELICYSSAAWLLGIILSRTGFKLPFIDRFRIGSIAAFAIHFLPIGTFGEGALDYYFLHAKGVKSGSIIITLILRIIFTYAAFLILFFIGIILVPTALHASLKLEIAIVLLALITLAGVIYLYYLYKNKKKFKNIWRKLINLFKKPIEKFRGKKLTEKKKDEVFEDIYGGLHLFSRLKRSTVLAIIAGILYWLGDMTCLFFVFLSFNYTINFGVLIFAYVLSTLAGMISFIPGGLGVTEGSYGLIFNSFSIPLSISLVAILVYRLFSFWLWIPVGLISYLTLSREINRKH